MISIMHQFIIFVLVTTLVQSEVGKFGSSYYGSGAPDIGGSGSNRGSGSGNDEQTDCYKIKWTKNGRCGVNFGNTVCNGESDGKGNLWTYCSNWGWCGQTNAHNVG